MANSVRLCAHTRKRKKRKPLSIFLMSPRWSGKSKNKTSKLKRNLKMVLILFSCPSLAIKSRWMTFSTCSKVFVFIWGSGSQIDVRLVFLLKNGTSVNGHSLVQGHHFICDQKTASVEREWIRWGRLFAHFFLPLKTRIKICMRNTVTNLPRDNGTSYFSNLP